MASPIPMSKSGHKAKRVDFQQRLWFLVGVDLYVLVVHILEL